MKLLSDDTALRQVLLSKGGARSQIRKGAVLVEMSTVSPAVSTEISEQANALGVWYLRAPVSGSVALAEASTLTVVASGPKPVFDEIKRFAIYLNHGCVAKRV